MLQIERLFPLFATLKYFEREGLTNPLYLKIVKVEIKHFSCVWYFRQDNAIKFYIIRDSGILKI